MLRDPPPPRNGLPMPTSGVAVKGRIALAGGRWRHAICKEVDAVVRQHRVGEVRVIEQVEEIGLQLQFLGLAGA